MSPPNAADSTSPECLMKKYSLISFILLLGIASARIAATYTVFNDTIDEPAHIGCGIQWLDHKTYTYETEHPPLARVMTALGPYLIGVRYTGHGDAWAEGRAVLNFGGRFDRNIALARLGILPFFWLASSVVYLWARRSFGEPVAFFATLCFTNLPPVLAHAGLATTDMAAAGTMGAAFLAMLAWAERPSRRRSLVFAVSLAAAVLSKFSSLAFLPIAAVTSAAGYLLVERPGLGRIWEWLRAHLLPLIIVVVIASSLIWAGYRFSFQRVPAPELWSGIGEVEQHNRFGHPGYVLGQNGVKGWWYYYPVVFAVKTPLALIALSIAGIVVFWNRLRKANKTYVAPVAFTFGILFFVMAFSHINLGVRHVLAVYLGLTIIAGVGAQELWSSGRFSRAVLVGLLVWMVLSSTLSHPDYLAYFNELGGSHPEKILVDSDLDWGQDTKRLAHRLQELGVKEIAFDPFQGGYVGDLLARHEFPSLKPLNRLEPAPGWNAASITMLKLWRLGQRDHPNIQIWTDRIPPTERVGKGILLWYVP
jgi:Dolichyl-phosphate-mannose-protein mannosyltransferase